MRHRLACLALLMLARAVQAGPVPEALSIPVAGFSSAPAALNAWLFRATTPEPHPAVVMLHGCGGAITASGQLNARHRMWGEFLAENGYDALMLDSFAARGIRELCTQKMAERSLKEADRRGDAHAALAWLQQQSGVIPDRVALLGWSHGGGVVLDTVSHPNPVTPGFRAAIAFYPGCSARARSPERFHPAAPLLLLIGEADDWTPAAPCLALGQAVAARGEPMELVSYPGAYHDFDNPALKAPRLRSEVPNGVNPGKGTTVAPDPLAREDAKQRVLRFLKEMLK